jgi:hypothetical protein
MTVQRKDAFGGVFRLEIEMRILADEAARDEQKSMDFGTFSYA